MNLTEEIDIVNRYTAHVQQRATDLGLTIELDTDPDAFKAFLSAQEDSHGVATTLDPDCCLIPKNQFAWFLIKDGSVGVCSHAIRIFSTDDLRRDILTQRLFADCDVSWTTEDIGLIDNPWIGIMKGTIATGGGFYVRPDYRKEKSGIDFPFLFVRLLRILACRDFHIDHYISFINDTPKRKAWTQHINQNPNWVSLSNGHWNPHGKQSDVAMAYASRHELLAQAKREIEQD